MKMKLKFWKCKKNKMAEKLSDIRHDISNNLNVINGYISIMMLSELNEEQQQYFQHILEEVNIIHTYINQTLIEENFE